MSNLKLYGTPLAINKIASNNMNEINLTKNETKSPVKKLVENYIHFFISTDRAVVELRPLLSETFKFSGPLGTFTTRDSFLEDVKRDALSITDIKIHHILVEGQHASALYEVYTSDPEVKKLLISEWFTTEKNQITSIFSIYDATDVKDLFSRI